MANRINTSRLTSEDIVGAWAIIPTPATPDASDPGASNTVDLGETARVIDGLISAGVDGILSLGTLGECSSLSWDEKRGFIATMVDVARGRVPIFAGTSTMSTRETITQTRAAVDIGAYGTMIGPPAWNRPDTPTAVQFYRDVAEAVPAAAICVYANSGVFKFQFPPQFWTQVADIPQIIMAKTITSGTYLRDVRASNGRIRLMPIDAEYYAAARLDPESAVAFWSSGAACGPAPALALRDLVSESKVTGDWSRAKGLSERINDALLPIIVYGDMNEFQTHNVGLEKIRMDAAGWLTAGPNRPPHHIIPDRIRDLAVRGGQAWAQLQREYEGPCSRSVRDSVKISS
jgi:trans-o-hydroxybenzylidenepyruvate hydratase-aldolase